MHKILPKGQMWPAEAFYLARKAQNFLILLVSLIKILFEGVVTFTFWPLDMS